MERLEARSGVVYRTQSPDASFLTGGHQAETVRCHKFRVGSDSYRVNRLLCTGVLRRKWVRSSGLSQNPDEHISIFCVYQVNYISLRRILPDAADALGPTIIAPSQVRGRVRADECHFSRECLSCGPRRRPMIRSKNDGRFGSNSRSASTLRLLISTAALGPVLTR
jgi:hypothetical protein